MSSILQRRLDVGVELAMLSFLKWKVLSAVIDKTDMLQQDMFKNGKQQWQEETFIT